MLSLAVMAVSSNVVYGQSMNYDVHIGMNTTKYMSNDDPRMYGQSAKTGMELGFGARYTMKSGIELSSGVNLTMSSCSFSAFSDYIIGNQITTMYPQVNMRNVAIDIPLTLGYHIKVRSTIVGKLRSSLRLRAQAITSSVAQLIILCEAMLAGKMRSILRLALLR